MLIAGTIAAIAILGFLIFWLARRAKSESELKRHSISAEELHSLITSGQKVLVFDVRQSLDLLAYPEQIPGAKRVPPEEVLQTPSIMPKQDDVVIYCTCPGEKTSRRVLRRALGLGFSRIKFLQGGLAAWKRMGFPVEPFQGSLAFSSAPTPTI